ncbi:MAG: HIT domain-containing protein [Bryobacteraceae bacterium]|nr:HIT domain-containing protein [Bryobacteraceae bacterium]MCX7602862.1 HIT domain-containing protein [Bryobacteraceae bacterium]
MDRLWSPWRYHYVSTVSPGDECIFCAKAREEREEENLILWRGRLNYALLNLFPYTTGHLMITPYRHVAQLEELTDEEATELMLATRQAVRCLRAVYRPQGFNLGMNLGECAGAGIAGHLHMHVLPRWTGDANFMTTIAETRVMPEDLRETWRKLAAAFRGG